MKFQNSSIHGFKVMLCIKKRDERTDGRTEGRTDGRTNNPEAICPSNFFEVGGIKTKQREITPKVRKPKLQFLYMTCCLILLYISTKYHLKYSKGYSSYRADTK